MRVKGDGTSIPTLLLTSGKSVSVQTHIHFDTEGWGL